MFSWNEKGGMNNWGLIVSPPPSQTVPQVQGIIEYNQDANVTFTLKIPIESVAGDLLIYAIGTDGDPNITAGVEDWTEFPDVVHGSGGNGTTLLTAWKIADGTEVDFTVTLNQRERIAGHTINVRGFLDSQAPESPTGTIGTSAAADPAIITPTWGQDNNLYLAMASCDSGNLTSIAAPTNYQQLGFSVAVSGISGCASCINSRGVFSSTSEDADAMVPNFSTEWAANIMAIRGRPGASIDSTHLVPEGSVTSPRVEDPMITEQGDFLFTE